MAKIDFHNIAHSYMPHPQQESDWAIKPLNHTWKDGGAYALLGPSGCGKTTLLNIISGLLAPSSGQLQFDGINILDLPPEKRNIAQVFQFPVVYDTMSVRDNLAFPLKNRGVADSAIRTRVEHVAKLLEISDMLDMRAAGLSADAKQIISLGRGLTRDDVGAILFDEPLTVIDPHIKWRLRSSLKRLHRQTDFTMIYVTHDQTEALTFADEIAVMHDGRIVQHGTPTELFERPKHTFVGHFIGSPGMNILPCSVVNGAVYLGEHHIEVAPFSSPVKGDTQLGVRPEFVEFCHDGLPADIKSIQDLGRHRILNLTIAGGSIKMLCGEDVVIPEKVAVRFNPARTYLYENGWLK